MDFLKKNLAPITEKGWNEIENRAKVVIENHLVGRRFLKVEAPKGRNFEGVYTGRVEILEKNGLEYGLYKVQPLLETRISFTLDRWELDNIERGAKDVNFDNLDEAVKKASIFEENAIFYGIEEASIEGLRASTQPIVNFGKTEEETLKSIIESIYKLKDLCAEKPYVLVVSKEKWIYLNTVSKDSLLVKKLEKILGTEILVSNTIKEAFLLPYDNENTELHIGQDFSIGYQSSNDSEIKMYVTSSFTFRILDKNLVIVFE